MPIRADFFFLAKRWNMGHPAGSRPGGMDAFFRNPAGGESTLTEEQAGKLL